MNTELLWSNSPIHEEIRNMNTRPTPETDELVRRQLARVGMTQTILAAKLTLKCESLERERDEALEYADKLAEGLPEGMLPKDVEVLREANLGLATELAAVTEQRDRLAEALRNIISIYEHPDKWCIPSSSDMYDEALQSLTPNAGGMARELAAQDSDNSNDIDG